MCILWWIFIRIGLCSIKFLVSSDATIFKLDRLDYIIIKSMRECHPLMFRFSRFLDHLRKFMQLYNIFVHSIIILWSHTTRFITNINRRNPHVKSCFLDHSFNQWDICIKYAMFVCLETCMKLHDTLIRFYSVRYNCYINTKQPATTLQITYKASLTPLKVSKIASMTLQSAIVSLYISICVQICFVFSILWSFHDYFF